MPYRYMSEQLQHKQSGYTRLFPYCAPHTCTKCTERNTYTHPPEHIQMYEKKKQLSAVGATEQYIHINSQTTKPLFSLYLIDIVFSLPFSRSISLSCVCYCFWVDFVVIIIRYKCDLDGITSIYRVGIPISIERHHHLSIMHYKQTKRRMEKCLDALKISHRTKEPTTIKKLLNHTQKIHTHTYIRPTRKKNDVPCAVFEKKKKTSRKHAQIWLRNKMQAFAKTM